MATNQKCLTLTALSFPAKQREESRLGVLLTEFLSLNHPESTTQLADAEEHDFQAIKLWAKNGMPARDSTVCKYTFLSYI
jgi:hypothetical protein